MAGVSGCCLAALSSSPSGAALFSVSAPQLRLCSPPPTAWAKKKKESVRIGNKRNLVLLECHYHSSHSFFQCKKLCTDTKYSSEHLSVIFDSYLNDPQKTFDQCFLTTPAQPQQLLCSGGCLHTVARQKSEITCHNDCDYHGCFLNLQNICQSC